MRMARTRRDRIRGEVKRIMGMMRTEEDELKLQRAMRRLDEVMDGGATDDRGRIVPIRQRQSFGRARDRASLLQARLGGFDRIILVGGPRSGKSTTAVRLGERYGLEARHADGLIGQMDWSEASSEVATWFNSPGKWVIEGVSTPRALRKWLQREPAKRLDGVAVVVMNEAVQVRTPRQEGMAKSVDKVFAEIRDELIARGATVEA